MVRVAVMLQIRGLLQHRVSIRFIPFISFSFDPRDTDRVTCYTRPVGS